MPLYAMKASLLLKLPKSYDIKGWALASPAAYPVVGEESIRKVKRSTQMGKL
jgi:hypothetical protein